MPVPELEKRLVVQHNRLIEAVYRLPVEEQLLIKTLVSRVGPKDMDFRPHTLRVADLAGLMGMTGGDAHAAVEWATKRLAGRVVALRDGDGKELQVSWLSSALYDGDEGSVSLCFDPRLKPFLLRLKNNFTIYELGNVVRLKRTYSIRIYELLKQYQPVGRRRFTLDRLREVLMLRDGEYGTYNNFKKWVLVPSREELGRKTDIDFTWNEERERGRVVAVEFVIKAQSKPETQPERAKIQPMA